MSHDFSVTASRLLVDAPVIALRKDTLTMPDGGCADREIIEHFGAVAVVALDEDNRLIMVEQYRHSVQQRLLELPAGLLDVAGEDELVAAQRELGEEAGLAAQDWGVLVDLVTSPGFAEEAIRIFIARGLSQVDRPEPEHEEADMQSRWLELFAARDAVLRGEIVNGIAVAGILAAANVVENNADARPATEPFTLRPTALAERRTRQGVVPDMKRI